MDVEIHSIVNGCSSLNELDDDEKNENGIMNSNFVEKLLNEKEGEKNEETSGSEKEEINGIEKEKDNKEEINGTPKEEKQNEEISEIKKEEDNKEEVIEIKKEEDNKEETSEIKKEEEKNEEINGIEKNKETSEIEKEEEKNEEINGTPKEEDNKVETNEIEKVEEKNEEIIEIKKEEEINGTPKEEDNKVETSEIKKEEDNKNEIIENKKEEDKSLSNIKKTINELEVYDIIIDINAIKSLFTTGWKEYSSKKGRERYEEQKDKRSVVVSVIGNKNKGKSYFLSKLSGINLPSGYSVVTKGLSVKYPQIEKQNIILLDTAGFETPLVQNEVYQLENDINAKDEKYNKEIRELARDREMTEYFLQKFVLTQANILVCLVGQLTFNDQKFLSKIRNECGDKTLFVLHNLQNLTTLHEVDQYINEVLKCSLTFKLKENKYMYFENKPKEIKENTIFYTEIYEDTEKNDINKDEKDIVHLIMARENTEAGDYYNNSTINYIKNHIISYIGIEKFPVKEKIKDFLFETSKEIMEEGIETEDEIKIIEDKNEIKEIIEEDEKQKSEKNKKKKEEDIKEDENEKKEEEEVKSLIKLYPKPNKKYTLKKYLIDELGQNLLVGTAFQPKYRYYKDTQNNKFIIQISMCGGTRNLRIKPKVVEDKYYFHIEGYKTFNVINPKEEIEIPEYKKNIREHGFFDFDIIVSADEVVLAGQKPKTSKEYGIITFEYDLFDNKE